jgi:hypothetical protein
MMEAMGLLAFIQRDRTNKLLADQNSIMLTGRTVTQNEIARNTANWQQTAKGQRLYERSLRTWSRMSDHHPEPEWTAKLEDLIVKHQHHHILVAVFRELIERRTAGSGEPTGDAEPQ